MTRSRTRFALVPEWAYTHPVMRKPPSTLAVYVALCGLSNYKDRTGRLDWQEIATATNDLSRSVIFSAIASLRAAGIVVDLGDGAVFLPIDEPGVESPSSRTGESEFPDSGVRVSGSSPISTEGSEDARPSPRGEYESEFAPIWAAYPRKRARKAALNAFIARRRNRVPRAELATAVENYAESIRVAGTEERFVLLGATFFGPAERWKDYLTVERLSVASRPGEIEFDPDAHNPVWDEAGE